MYDVVIVGGGPAGVTAAIYANRYDLNTLLISPNIGGWVRESPMIQNYPGMPGTVNGMDISQRFRKQLEGLKVPIIEQEVSNISKSGKDFIIATATQKFQAKAVVLATGSKKRMLNVPGEEQFFHKGVSACVTCDGPLFSGKVVGVVGGADSAAVAALMLTEYCKQVHLFVRGGSLRAKPSLQDRLNENSKIKVHFNTSVTEFVGEQFLSGVKLNDGSTLKLDAVFIEIGMLPATGLAKQIGVELDSAGLVKVGEDMSTNIPGFFAAGDLTTGSNRFRQIATAISEGAIAANSIYNYIRAR